MARRKLLAVLLGVAFVAAVDGALGWLLPRLKMLLSFPCSLALALRPVAQRNQPEADEHKHRAHKNPERVAKVGPISSSSDHRRIAVRVRRFSDLTS